MKQKAKLIRSLAVAGTGVLVIGGLAAAAILDPTETLDKRRCVIGRAASNTLVVALDTSDPLVSAQPREIDAAVGQALGELAKGDHIVVLDAAGKPPTEIMPVVDQCLPGDEDNIARNAFKNAILAPIEAHLKDVKSQPATAESPLAETILSVAADASLRDAVSKLTILFITDGLQNSAFQSAYRSGSNFPVLEGAPLKGVTVHIFLVKNDRDFALQPRAVERFNAWLTESDATVIYAAPAWLAMANAKNERAHK